MNINVFGEKIKIKFAPNLYHNGKPVWGLYSYNEKTIFIEEMLTKKGNEVQYFETLIHELIHAMSHVLSYHQTSLTGDMEELIADNVSKMILSTFDISEK